MATLARRLIADFPDEYRYFSTPSFVFHGHTIYNHDMMLEHYPGADGLKTGFTVRRGPQPRHLRRARRRAGSSAVVLGAGSNGERDAHMMALLDQGFERMDVPVEMVHRDVQPWRGGSLMASAQAATISAFGTARLAHARPTSLRRPLPAPPVPYVSPLVRVHAELRKAAAPVGPGPLRGPALPGLT